MMPNKKSCEPAPVCASVSTDAGRGVAPLGLVHKNVMRKQHFIFTAVVVAVLAIGYAVGWHTSLGRFTRGISSVAVINHSGRELPYVSFYLFDAHGEQI